VCGPFMKRLQLCYRAAEESSEEAEASPCRPRRGDRIRCRGRCRGGPQGIRGVDESRAYRQAEGSGSGRAGKAGPSRAGVGGRRHGGLGAWRQGGTHVPAQQPDAGEVPGRAAGKARGAPGRLRLLSARGGAAGAPLPGPRGVPQRGTARQPGPASARRRRQGAAVHHGGDPGGARRLPGDRRAGRAQRR